MESRLYAGPLRGRWVTASAGRGSVLNQDTRKCERPPEVNGRPVMRQAVPPRTPDPAVHAMMGHDPDLSRRYIPQVSTIHQEVPESPRTGRRLTAVTGRQRYRCSGLWGRYGLAILTQCTGRSPSASHRLCLPEISSTLCTLRIMLRPASLTGHADRVSRTAQSVRFGSAEPGDAPDRERCASSSIGDLAETSSRATPIAASRPAVLDVALSPVARMAASARHRQARNGPQVASTRVSALLAMEESASRAWVGQESREPSKRSSARCATPTRLDRHRGGGHPPTPATPPCVRVRTRRFERVTLTTVDQ